MVMMIMLMAVSTNLQYLNIMKHGKLKYDDICVFRDSFDT